MLAPRLSLLDHHPIGIATGVFVEARGDWPTLVEIARGVSPFVTELTALSESELPYLLRYLGVAEDLAFAYLSVHAPSKGRKVPEAELIEMLRSLPSAVEAIVVHPDTMVEPIAYRRWDTVWCSRTWTCARRPAGRLMSSRRILRPFLRQDSASMSLTLPTLTGRCAKAIIC